jgi:hypothetical protein
MLTLEPLWLLPMLAEKNVNSLAQKFFTSNLGFLFDICCRYPYTYAFVRDSLSCR